MKKILCILLLNVALFSLSSCEKDEVIVKEDPPIAQEPPKLTLNTLHLSLAVNDKEFESVIYGEGYHDPAARKLRVEVSAKQVLEGYTLHSEYYYDAYRRLYVSNDPIEWKDSVSTYDIKIRAYSQIEPTNILDNYIVTHEELAVADTNNVHMTSDLTLKLKHNTPILKLSIELERVSYSGSPILGEISKTAYFKDLKINGETPFLYKSKLDGDVYFLVGYPWREDSSDLVLDYLSITDKIPSTTEQKDEYGEQITPTKIRVPYSTLGFEAPLSGGKLYSAIVYIRAEPVQAFSYVKAYGAVAEWRYEK
jgi:hypothetical protein